MNVTTRRSFHVTTPSVNDGTKYEFKLEPKGDVTHSMWLEVECSVPPDIKTISIYQSGNPIDYYEYKAWDNETITKFITRDGKRVYCIWLDFWFRNPETPLWYGNENFIYVMARGIESMTLHRTDEIIPDAAFQRKNGIRYNVEKHRIMKLDGLSFDFKQLCQQRNYTCYGIYCDNSIKNAVSRIYVNNHKHAGPKNITVLEFEGNLVNEYTLLFKEHVIDATFSVTRGRNFECDLFVIWKIPMVYEWDYEKRD